MNYNVYDDSIRYINKSIKKLNNGSAININLLNNINNKFLLGKIDVANVLLSTNVNKVKLY